MFKNALVAVVLASFADARKGKAKGSDEEKKDEEKDYELAICRMTTNSGTGVNPAATAGMPGGFFSLRQMIDGPGMLKIAGVSYGLSPETSHGFHIHAGSADFTADPATTANICASSGGHFNPDTTDHGAWDNAIENKHYGDLMQLWTDSLGKSVYAYQTMYGNIVDPNDPNYIVGKAMTIHLLPDDEGLGGDEGSRKGGNAGERIACCNIELSNSKRYNRIWEDVEELVEDEMNGDGEKSEKSAKEA